MNFSLRDLFRLNLRFHTGREAYGISDFFVKRCMNELKCAYEYNVLKKIANAHPLSSRAPKAFKVYRNLDGPLMIMDRIRGTFPENYIVKYLLFGEDKSS
ncbi:MAG: hypothetical protein QXR51_06275 [Desulfurococcaceae archaeon]